MSRSARFKSRRISAARRRLVRFTSRRAVTGVAEVRAAREAEFGLAQPMAPRSPSETRVAVEDGGAGAAEPEVFGRVARAGRALELSWAPLDEIEKASSV